MIYKLFYLLALNANIISPTNTYVYQGYTLSSYVINSEYSEYYEKPMSDYYTSSYNKESINYNISNPSNMQEEYYLYRLRNNSADVEHWFLVHKDKLVYSSSNKRNYEYNNQPVNQYDTHSSFRTTPFDSSGNYLNSEMVAKTIYTNCSAVSNQCQYSYEEIREIVKLYEHYGNKYGINWVLLLSQNVLETNWMSCWTANRGNKNPAGIGLSGVKSYTTPASTQGWIYDGRKWWRGYKFNNWDESVRIHVSLILLYQEDGKNKDSEDAFTRNNGMGIPEGYKGKMSNISYLNNTWAMDSNYSQKIAKRANILSK